jgi:phthalate 4,5-cis-dihydrodiol dehydrogenase
MTGASVQRRWRLGIIGLGVAGRGAVAAARALAPRVSVTRASDPDLKAVADWPASAGLRIAESAEAVCAADDIDVVYIASPSSLHGEHAVLAARYGKHMMIEKPMAVSIADGGAIVEAAREHGVQVVAVHTPSFEAPLRTARAVIASGDVGRPLHLTQVKYVPWLVRPRLEHELDNASGGGVINRQAPHQVDMALYLIGGLPTSVHATSGSHPQWPQTDGHYTAMVTFANDAVATMIFNGYGYFSTAALTGNVGEDGHYQYPGAGQRLRQFRGADKSDMRSGRIHEVEHGYDGTGMRFAPVSGWSVLSCEGADLVQSPTGLVIHRPDGIVEVPFLSSDGYLAAAFDELDHSLATGTSPLHDGRWGQRIIEVVEAIRESAATGRTVTLLASGRHQRVGRLRLDADRKGTGRVRVERGPDAR